MNSPSLQIILLLIQCCFTKTERIINIDNGNELMVTQFVFVIEECMNFKETLMEIDIIICQCYCKKQINNNFPWTLRVLLLTIDSNDVKMSKTLL